MAGNTETVSIALIIHIVHFWKILDTDQKKNPKEKTTISPRAKRRKRNFGSRIVGAKATLGFRASEASTLEKVKSGFKIVHFRKKCSSNRTLWEEKAVLIPYTLRKKNTDPDRTKFTYGISITGRKCAFGANLYISWSDLRSCRDCSYSGYWFVPPS